ncbi:amidase signature domain-containing protein, partial [Coniella lustricola]
LGLLPRAALAQLTGTGLSVVLNNIDLYISPYIAGRLTAANATALSAAGSIYNFAPVAVVPDSQTGAADADLTALFANWTALDDVFQSGFTSVVVNALDTQLAWTTGNISSSSSSSTAASTSVPPGPYFVDKTTGALHQVYRLYDDFAGAFTSSLLQIPGGQGFQPLSAQVASSATLTVGVPSRLYFTKTADKPLAGVRVGVKDIFHLAGVKSSYGNRAWYSLYPAANTTAPAIQRLIDAGAQIIGLQKPSQFANGETATGDWVDYHAPFNPRGDGYQDASSSSAGAGASIASYAWLDLAVGSDTGGSIRGPAEVQNVFGNRPSHGLVSLDGVMPLSPVLDTAGFLTRDVQVWDAAQQVMYGANYTSLLLPLDGADEATTTPTVAYPTTVYTVGFPTNASASAADALLVAFADGLAAFVGGAVRVLDLAAEWEQANITSAGLDEVLNITYPVLIGSQQTELVRDPFYADYAGQSSALHDNRRPFVDPAPLIRWAFTDSLPDGALDEAIANKTLFMDWFNSEILAPVDGTQKNTSSTTSTTSQCSSGILLYPGSTGTQTPRNVYRAAPSVPYGFSSGRISVLSECPDSVFPVGEVSGFSDITQHNESWPVTVDVLVAKGCDGLLVKLAQDLAAQGLVRIPHVGRSLEGGAVLMR